jgi:hypothetical protein
VFLPSWVVDQHHFDNGTQICVIKSSFYVIQTPETFITGSNTVIAGYECPGRRSARVEAAGELE